MRILLPCLAALALNACAASTTSVKNADPCAEPVLLPERWLSDQEVELLWARDRRALLDCGGKVEVLSGRKPLHFDRGDVVQASNLESELTGVLGAATRLGLSQCHEAQLQKRQT